MTYTYVWNELVFESFIEEPQIENSKHVLKAEIPKYICTAVHSRRQGCQGWNNEPCGRFLRCYLKVAPRVSSHCYVKSFGACCEDKANTPPENHRITEIKGETETFFTDKTKKNFTFAVLTGDSVQDLPLEKPFSIVEFLEVFFKLVVKIKTLSYNPTFLDSKTFHLWEWENMKKLGWTAVLLCQGSFLGLALKLPCPRSAVSSAVEIQSTDFPGTPDLNHSPGSPLIPSMYFWSMSPFHFLYKIIHLAELV